jgi:hypothetical protein
MVEHVDRIDLHGQPLDLDLTLACGQAFRWRKTDNGTWRGVVRDKLIELAMKDGSLLWRTYPVPDRALLDRKAIARLSATRKALFAKVTD